MECAMRISNASQAHLCIFFFWKRTRKSSVERTHSRAMKSEKQKRNDLVVFLYVFYCATAHGMVFGRPKKKTISSPIGLGVLKILSLFGRMCRHFSNSMFDTEPRSSTFIFSHFSIFVFLQRIFDRAPHHQSFCWQCQISMNTEYKFIPNIS